MTCPPLVSLQPPVTLCLFRACQSPRAITAEIPDSAITQPSHLLPQLFPYSPVSNYTVYFNQLKLPCDRCCPRFPVSIQFCLPTFAFTTTCLAFNYHLFGCPHIANCKPANIFSKHCFDCVCLRVQTLISHYNYSTYCSSWT